VPRVIMLMLILIPAIMSAIAVVREKETGSIANFYSTPTTKLEFLFGKQLPYIAVAMISFVLLVILAIVLFGVPVKGSLAMLAVGSLLYVAATTGFGEVVSTFTRAQGSAGVATPLSSLIPALNFSGFPAPGASPSRRRRGTVVRPGLSAGLVPADQRGRVHERAGVRAVLAEADRARGLLLALPRGCAAHSAQAGEVTCRPQPPARTRRKRTDRKVCSRISSMSIIWW